MNLYLVGGAVRDQLLGLPVTEKDWVVVGAAAEEMLQQGFQQVGKDFPVFLHPKTHEEYALARRERKVGRGYTGFAFDASPNVTLEDDLKRRDLTINAMAQTMDGRLIDPYGGEKDLQQKLLRHVSDAFVEDPVRILRVGRFAARFFELGFKVAPETLALMKNMVQSGEVSALVPERVWKELERALLENHPEQFFQLLADCGAAAILFPHDLDLNALQRAVGLSKEGDIRFAALCQKLTETQLNDWCDRFRIPNEYRELALLVIKFAKYYPNLKNAAAESILQFLYAADAFRREERFKKFLLACEACYACSPPLLDCLQAAKTVHIQEMPPEIKGKAIADYLYKKRLEKIEQLGKSGC